MSAWGPKPFDNDLALLWLNSLLYTNVFPEIIKKCPVETSPELLKAQCAYQYDRQIAAVEVLLTFVESMGYEINVGWIDVAIINLNRIANHNEWIDSWDDENQKKGSNYRESIHNQVLRLEKIKSTCVGEICRMK